MHIDMIFIDFEKDFDPLDHKLLYKKMICLDFKTSVIKWFKFHLSSRKFFLFMNGTFSEAGTLNCGVPQGSMMGPLLLSMYIYDLRQP